jgi:hypothetical protein
MADFIDRKEIEELKRDASLLKPNFNIIKKNKNFFITGIKKTDFQRKMAKKLLLFSLILSLLSVSCFVISYFLILVRPTPDIYLALPTGKIVGPLAKVKIKE